MQQRATSSHAALSHWLALGKLFCTRVSRRQLNWPLLLLAAAAPLLAAPAPSLATHCWVHNKFQKTKQQLMHSAATLVFAHLVEGTAPVWTRVSGAWRAAYIKGWSGARGVRVVWGALAAIGDPSVSGILGSVSGGLAYLVLGLMHDECWVHGNATI